MKPLNLAVIGVGALGRHHARILSQMDGVDLVGVSDLNFDAAERVAGDCGTEAFSDYRDFLDRADAVSIVVPTVAHFAVAGECLQRGIPTLVEKPIASNVDEAQQLVELAETHEAILQVGHIERFNPAYEEARQRTTAPRYIRAERVSPFPFRSTDIGVVLDLMIHDIELVLDLTDSKVRSVEALGVSIIDRAHEDTVTARIHFDSGCIADLTASRVCPFARRAIQIWSQDGCITADLGTREVVSYGPTDALRFGPSLVQRAQQPGADVEQLKRDIFGKFLKIEQPDVAESDALTAELESFIDCVRHNQRPVVDGRQALAAMHVAEQVLESTAAHQWDGHAGGPIGPFGTAADQIRRAA